MFILMGPSRSTTCRFPIHPDIRASLHLQADDSLNDVTDNNYLNFSSSTATIEDSLPDVQTNNDISKSLKSLLIGRLML